jgi:hypothetical protein
MYRILKKPCDSVQKSVLQYMTEGYACIEVIFSNEHKPVDFIIHEVNNALKILCMIKLTSC